MVDQPVKVKRRRVEHAEKWKKPGDWWMHASGKWEMTKCERCSKGTPVDEPTCRDCRGKATTAEAPAVLRGEAEHDRRKDDGEL